MGYHPRPPCPADRVQLWIVPSVLGLSIEGRGTPKHGFWAHIRTRVRTEWVTTLPKIFFTDAWRTKINYVTSSSFITFLMFSFVGTSDSSLSNLITFNTTSLFSTDIGCPINWEPSGSDFLSPCLQVRHEINYITLLNWYFKDTPGTLQ